MAFDKRVGSMRLALDCTEQAYLYYKLVYEHDEWGHKLYVSVDEAA